MNVNINSLLGAAIEIRCGKKINIILEPGTINNLMDSEDGSQKAALYCKGHMCVSGAGELNVKGMKTHAIKTKEYFTIEDATVNIMGAIDDAMHIGQYFKMKSGSVHIDENTQGDGIQVEKTDDLTDENNGCVFLENGQIDMEIVGIDNKGIKADSTIVVQGGNIEINANGKGARGIQTSRDMIIGEETGVTNVLINANGSLCAKQECYPDYHRCMGIKVDGLLTINSGYIQVTNNGKKSRAIKVGSIIQNGGTIIGDVDNK